MTLSRKTPPAADRPHVEIIVVDVKGSGPREAGARMRWFPDGSAEGTIGGGNLELQCLGEAEALWNDPERASAFIEYPLSAELGQCCGGLVKIFLGKKVAPEEVLICGAGHVATQLASVLAETPLRVTVVDARPDWADPERFGESIDVIADDPDAVVRDWGERAKRTHLLILTHEHALDQELCRLALRFDFKWIGLIGSRTKWRRFRQRLAAMGFTDAELARIVCPIGDPKLGRTPQEIAIGVGAQLLAIYHAADSERRTQTDEGEQGAEAAPGKRGALILAGGASRRMGRWKGALEFDGEPLLAAHARIFTEAGADVWRAVYPEMYREEAERIAGPDHRIMTTHPEAPLFASIQLGLREMIRTTPDLDSLLITPVDMVPLSPDLVAALWDRHESTGAWATRPAVKVAAEADSAKTETRHGHPVILGHRLFASILAADPSADRLDFLIRDLAAEHKVEFEWPDSAALTNMNTPEDVEEARAE